MSVETQPTEEQSLPACSSRHKHKGIWMATSEAGEAIHEEQTSLLHYSAETTSATRKDSKTETRNCRNTIISLLLQTSNFHRTTINCKEGVHTWPRWQHCMGCVSLSLSVLSVFSLLTACSTSQPLQ